MKDKKEKMQEILREKDIRVTRQRESILEVIFEAEKPVTATYIFSRLQESCPNLKLSTVYRNMNLFVKKGLLRKLSLDIDNNESYFELIRDEHHHHLICIQCNKVLPLDCPLGEFEEKIREETAYRIIDHSVKIFGICPHCQEFSNT
ncbi:MAG: Fur family transcriptional regulator [Halanaerobiales bacterium]